MPHFGLRIPQIPRSEYRLMHDLIDHLELRDVRELICVVMILTDKLLQAPEGREVVVDVVNEWRNTVKKHDRVYSVSTRSDDLGQTGKVGASGE